MWKISQTNSLESNFLARTYLENLFPCEKTIQSRVSKKKKEESARECLLRFLFQI